MKQLILGSQSPRRKEILSYFSIPFTQASPFFDENSLPFHGLPKDYVLQLSAEKANSLLNQFSHAIILTADTIVYKEGKIYDKPKNEEAAIAGLTELSGKWHSVYTGITLVNETKFYQTCEETRVLFNTLSDNQIRTYQKKNK